jgi:glycerophosphoryl diester phosphodiesterase
VALTGPESGDCSDHRPGTELLAVAHRAGNSGDAIRAALAAGVDLVEADVRYFRGELEVRHLKTLGPTLLWDHPWQLVRRRDARVLLLADLLTGLDGSRLLLDLKGVHPSLAPAVARQLRTLAPGVPVAVCTRHWWMLDAFVGDGAIRLVPSVGSRRELRRLAALLRRPPSRWPGGRRAFGVSVRRNLLTPAAVTALHRSVDHVLTWPVDAPWDLAEAVRLGARGVIGMNLPLLKTLAAER